MQSYTFDTLSTLLGQQISVMDGQGNQVVLNIDRVEKSRLDSDQWEAFSAYFIGDSSFHVPQGTYQLSHPELGSDVFFISPKSAVEYELVINRKKE